MNNELKKIEQFKKINNFTGKIAQTKYVTLSRLLSKILSKMTLSKNKAQTKDNVKDIAYEWQRMFGLDEYFKVVKIENDTAYCEIHFDCSLEKTGNIEACHRLMEYDRLLLNKIGGKLAILKSRANPEIKNCCTIAIRRINDNRDDLIQNK